MSRVSPRQMLVKNVATVLVVEPTPDDLIRIVFTPAENRLAWTPGQALAILVDPAGSTLKDRWRHYTVRDRDVSAGTLELLAVRRDADTPAQQWLGRLDVGSTFTFMGPGGKPTVDLEADRAIFVGDRTSVASIGAMLDALDAHTGVVDASVVLATEDHDRLPAALDTAATAVCVVGGLHDTSLVIDALPHQLAVGTVAYVTGELHMVRAVRTALDQRGLTRRSIRCQAHWTPSRRGM